MLPYLHILLFIAFSWFPPKVTILMCFSWLMTHFHIFFPFYSSQPVSGTDTCSLLYRCTPMEWQRNGEKKYSKKKNPCSLKQFIKKRGMHFQNLPRQFFCHSQGLYRCLSPSRSWQTLGIGLHRLCRWLGSKNGWMIYIMLTPEGWIILHTFEKTKSIHYNAVGLDLKIHIPGPL